MSGTSQGQTPETVSQVIAALDFDGTYAARVDALIAQTADKPAIWSGSKSAEGRERRQAEVRSALLDMQEQVKARLHEALTAKFYEEELQDVVTSVAGGASLDDAELGYALNFEFDSAISGFILPMAAEKN